MKTKAVVLSTERIEGLIRVIRGQRVILDSDLAHLYGLPTHRLNEAVKRNRTRFPEDFMFQLTKQEYQSLISQFAISKPRRGGRRTMPYAFTEYGAIMAANVLNSEKAIAMSIYVIRAFVRMREALVANHLLEKRLEHIEKTLLSHDTALRDLYQKIRPLLLGLPEPKRGKIGFHVKERKVPYLASARRILKRRKSAVS